jgi:hypothetical protein
MLRNYSFILFIPDSARAVWTSAIYHHYNVSLSRNEEKRTMEFVFTCKENPLHEPVSRSRRDEGDKTRILRKGIELCSSYDGSTLIQQAPQTSAVAYSPLNHRVLVAIQCALSYRSLSRVEDAFYKEEMECLRPGTHLPEKGTIIKDINKIHDLILSSAKAYFVSFIQAFLLFCP